MGRSVLILATRYDAATLYTFEWAQKLHSDLLRAGHSSIFLDAAALCYGGSGLADAIDRSEYIVFYGHAETDRWIAVPGLNTTIPGLVNASAVDLVSTSTSRILNGRHVYASCCHSVAGLGTSYVASFTGADYMGYSNMFEFEHENHGLFRDVVNPSVQKFIQGTPKAQLKTQLTHDWDALRNDFMAGRFSSNANSFAAGQCADNNSKTIAYC